MTATAWPPRQYDDGITASEHDWMTGAPCNSNPDLFFSDNPDDITEAKRICRNECGSARRLACLNYLRQEGFEWGVWAGIARDERISKQCAACDQEMPLGEFPLDPHTLDGRKAVCRPCATKQSRKGNNALPPEKRAASLRVAQEKNAALRDENEKRFAVLRGQGLLIKQACAVIGVSPKTGTRYEARRVARLRKPEVAA